MWIQRGKPCTFLLIYFWRRNTRCSSLPLLAVVFALYMLLNEKLHTCLLCLFLKSFTLTSEAEYMCTLHLVSSNFIHHPYLYIFFYLGVLVTWYSIRLKFRELCKTASSILITAVLWKAHCARLSGDTAWNSQQASHGLCRYIDKIHGVPNCFHKIINAKTVHYSQQRHDDGIKVKWLWSTCCSCVIAAEHKQKPNAFVWCWVWSPATYLVNK